MDHAVQGSKLMNEGHSPTATITIHALGYMLPPSAIRTRQSAEPAHEDPSPIMQRLTRIPTLLLFAALLLVGPLSQANAQNMRRGEQHMNRPSVEERIDRLDARLDLTDEQEEQIARLMESGQKAGRAWHEANPDATREEMHAWRDQHRESMHSAIGALLSDEQRTEWKAMQEMMGPKHRGQRGMHRGARLGDGPRGERGLPIAQLAEVLDLNQEQQEALRELREAQRERAQAWRDSAPHSADERDAFRTSQREAMQAGLEEILDDQQLDELEAFRAGHRSSQRKVRRSAMRSDMMRGDMMRGLRALDLTDEQQEALRELRTEHRGEMQEWMEAHDDATPDERRTFMQEHREEMRAAVMELLTPEQRERAGELDLWKR